MNAQHKKVVTDAANALLRFTGEKLDPDEAVELARVLDAIGDGLRRAAIAARPQGVSPPASAASRPAPPFNELDPGIRRTVAFLHSKGFTTTDSGDGVSKPDMECATDVPNGCCVVEPASAPIGEARRLRQELGLVGVGIDAIGPDDGAPSIQASYDPGDDSACLMLLGVNDAMLPAETT